MAALSANVLPEESEKCSAAGMDDFVGRPAPMPVLADKLRTWMPHVAWPDSLAPASGASAGPAGVRDADVRIDPALLDELTGGDDELVAGILADFTESTAADLVSLRDALAGSNAEEVRRQAHRLKVASRAVGAHEVARLAARLETAASSDGRLEVSAADR
jgi:HPt (histidine-containing phosphotransfer) domain-containing protein